MSKPLGKIIGITFLVQILTFAMTVGNNVLAARWLGPMQFGVMVTLLLLPEIINKCTNMGLETTILYFVGNRRFAEKAFIGTTIINGFVLYCLGVAVIIIFILFGGVNLLLDTAEQKLAGPGAWLSIYLLFAAILHEYASNIWLGRQEFNRFNGNILFRPFLYFVMLILAYVTNHLTVSAALIIYATSWLLPGIYIWLKSVLPVPLVWNREIMKETFHYGSQIMGINLLVFLIYRSDIFLIGYFLSQEAVAYYYVGIIIAERLHYVTKSIRIVILPAASHSEAQQEKIPVIARTSLLLIAIGAIILAVIAHWLIPFVFSATYEAAVLPLILLLPGVVTVTLPKILSADFAARGVPKYDLYACAVNFAVNVTLNFWWIPIYGIAGAALSSSISYTVAAVLTCYFYKKVTGTPMHSLLMPRLSDWERLKRL